MALLLFFLSGIEETGLFQVGILETGGCAKKSEKASMYNIINADSRNLSQIFIYSLRQLAIICVLMTASFAFSSLIHP